MKNKLTNDSSKPNNYPPQQPRQTFDSKIADVNLGLQKMNKKLEKQSTYQEHLQSLIEEEIKLRQDIEKKTFLMKENMGMEIRKLKEDFKNFKAELNGNMQNNKTEMMQDYNTNISKLMTMNEENMKKLNEFELKSSRMGDEKNSKIQDVLEKLEFLENDLVTQIQYLKKQITDNTQEIICLKSQMTNHKVFINDEINLIKNDITKIKSDVQLMKNLKENVSKDMCELIKEIEAINQRMDNVVNEVNISETEMQTKLNEYETFNRKFAENFSNLKEDFLQQIDRINTLKENEMDKLNEQLFGQISKLKGDMDKFNLNVIQENQKFIDYSQNQLNEHNNNMKKLFEFTSDDIDVLKKKSDTLENLIKNTRNEMINNLNSMEGFLTKRYDALFKSLGGIDEDRKFNF